MSKNVEVTAYDSTADTMRHVWRVEGLIEEAIANLYARAKAHDDSKFLSPEKEAFDRETPKLKELEYGSDEYRASLDRLGVALQHHYEHNSHHPEHWENGIRDMSLFDVLEMLLDWKAASERHEHGDIIKSIDQNQGRFGYSDELRLIFLNTAQEMGWMEDGE